MNKKVVSALLFGSLVFATGTFTACSDYDEDIDSLNERVDAVEKSIAGLQASIEAGNVITNVESTDNGVKVTLSDGTSFELTNGKDGAAGTPGSVVTIGDNGNWFIDGVDTGKPSRGEKGEQGEQGVQGPQGEQGIQGEQGPQGEQGIQGEQGESGDYAGKGNPGDYYYPAEDGLWHKYVYDAATGKYADSGETAGAWKSAEGGVTAVYDTTTGLLTLANVVVDGVINQTVTIEMYAELKSLAVIPETIDPETRMPIVNFYNILHDGKVVGSTNAIARYRLNPSNANVDESLISWSLIDRTAIDNSRAAGDNENSLLSIYGTPERKADELYVSMQSNSTLEELAGNQLPIVALKATNKYNEEEIVSDYLTVGVQNLSKFAIINLIPDVAEKDTAFDATAIKYLRVNRPAPDSECDMQLNADKSYDLHEMVNTLAKEMTSATLEALDVKGLTYKFSKPDHYYSDSPEKTDNQDFIILDENGVVTPNVEKYGKGVQGRTPIVYVEAIVGGQTIASAYVKIDITENSDLKMREYSVDLGEVEYADLTTKIAAAFGWERMNTEVYKEINIDREGFKQHYTSKLDEDNEKGVILNAWDPATDEMTSDVVTFQFNPSTIAVQGKEGEVRTATIYYESDQKYNYPDIAIHFTYSIKHTHVFPEFNENYQDEDNALLVMGELNKTLNKWTYRAEIREQFKDYLEGYEWPKNHEYAGVEVVSTGFATMSPTYADGGTINDQYITLNGPIYKTTHQDVYVKLISKMANGESCEKEYTVRFVNPFKVRVKPVELKTLKEATSADLSKYVVVEDIHGRTLYEVGNPNANNDGFLSAAAEYGLNKQSMTFEFTDKFGAEFGDKLNITDGVITWNNGGNDLQNTLNTAYNVDVTFGGYLADDSRDVIAIVAADGSVEILSTAESVE